MHAIQQDYFPRWPYDTALRWMAEAHQLVQENNHRIMVACGSHEENVVTLGRDHKKNRVEQARIEAQGHTIIRAIDRGGGATAHEPGQLVLYPVLHLGRLKLSPAGLVDLLQESMVLFLRGLGLCAQTNIRGPGVFLHGHKIGFIGLRIKAGISTHGIAINIFNDAHTFALFDPCGFKGLPITSLKNHVKIEHGLEEMARSLVAVFMKQLPPCGQG